MAKTKKTSPASIVRPPIVTVMGHVDHGKTTLLDVIRQANVAGKEAGGITQHVGAYQVKFQDKLITFIDTPGHAAFSKMRARGAQATDIVILVVAADDGVKPQTVESIKLILEAKVPVIVAINKMDAPGASPDMVKAQLTEHMIFCEGYGGQTPAVNISAKLKEGIDQLLEMILLMAELEELKADPTGPLEAVVVESEMDKNRGPVATVIVKNGTLTPGKTYFSQLNEVKIRSLNDEFGKSVKSGMPGQPVVITGFGSMPAVGSLITATPHEETAAAQALVSAEHAQNQMKLIIKADTNGTLEAILQSLTGEILLIDSGVGPVTESDVLMAHTTNSLILSFSVPVTTSAKKLAAIEDVKIKSFDIIYELLEYLEKAILKIIEPTINEQEQATAEITAIFDIKGDKIAGCKVKTGKLSRNFPVHIVREEKIIKDSIIKSLKQGKEDVDQVKAGNECGIVLQPQVDFKIGDMIKSYKIIEEDI